ncbi:uncharacterized protein LOC101235835 [Hydra vulgaris]|uniref:uncharacterized protein LOC101235835 n=1 Tax=Hydra vulgaris TaxID=6087 RepID=UPI001F5F9E50|nr:uncharacterized protein LOC101235835 [Hydra vulgaris]XP_047124491.1 uncharacterized protein LOC101235835 [Hydra vulgaris]
MAVLTLQAIINFGTLVLIRSCTPLMLHFAAINLHSFSLVVVFKCWITFTLFLLSALWFVRTDQDVKKEFITNLRDLSLYGRLIVIGIIQSGLPFLLLVYSIQYFPPTLIGVAIASPPWWILLIERLPFIGLSDNIHWIKKCSILLGLIGSIITYFPILVQSIACFPVHSSIVKINGSYDILKINTNQQLYYDSCLSGKELCLGSIALILAPIVLGIATVFWKMHQKNTHYLVSSIGQNGFGGLLAFFIWLISGEVLNKEQIVWNSFELIPSILFLGIATGWLATLLLHNLFLDVGVLVAIPTLIPVPFLSFFMDCLFAKSVVLSATWVIVLVVIGLVIITAAICLANLPVNESVGNHYQDLTQPLLSDSATNDGLGTSRAAQNNVHNESSNEESDHEEEIMIDNQNMHPSLPPLMAVT